MRNRVDEFVESQLELLDLERNAALIGQCELFRKATKKLLKNEGLLIDNLKFSHFISTISIKTSIAIERVKENGDSNNNFCVGDCVALVDKFETISHLNDSLFSLENDGKKNRKGNYELAILTKQKKGISFDLELSREDDETNWIEQCSNLLMIKIVNDVPYQRCMKTMNHLKKLDESKFSFLFQIELFPSKSSQWNIDDSSQLNEYQLEIVGDCVNRNDSRIQIIHGPPGTGKTRTLTHILKHLVEANPSALILAAAPSNVAVDNLMLQFIQLTSPSLKNKKKKKTNFFRIGHPSRSFVELSPYNLNNLLYSNKSNDSEVILDLKKEIKNEKNERVRGRLYGELGKYVRKATENLFDKTQIIFGTLSSFGSERIIKQLNRIRERISYVVIDECCQGLEADCWNVIIHGKRLILGGDHLQLSPTVLNEKVTEEKYSINIQKRLIDVYGENSGIINQLRIQYRMNEKIVKCSNEHLYGNLMETPEDIGNRKLAQNELDLEDEGVLELFESPITFIDTSHAFETASGNSNDEFHEVQLDDDLFNNSSYANVGECRVVVWYIKELISRMNCKLEDVGIITPYNLQRNLLNLNFPQSEIEIKTIDGFQGREKDVIIISLVRSNSDGNVGFSLNDHRLNVAITRAAKHLCIIANSSTFNRKKTSKFFSSIQTHFNENNRVFSINQFLHLMSDIRLQLHSSSYVRPSSSNEMKKKQESKRKTEVTYKNEERKEKFQKIIDDFVKSLKTDIELPNLNSYERMIVHDYCEKLKLQHSSVEVSKGKKILKIAKNKVHLDDDENSKLSKNDVGKTETNILTSNSVESEDEENDILESSQFGQNNPTDSSTSQSSSEQENDGPNDENVEKIPLEQKRRKKKKKLKKKLNPREEMIGNIEVKMDKVKSSGANEEETDEKFVKFHTQLNKICNFKNCTTKIHLIQKHCTFCDGRYCLSHGMEEVHGCGDQLKKKLLHDKNSNTVFNTNLTNKDKRKNKILFENKLNEMKNSRKKNLKKK